MRENEHFLAQKREPLVEQQCSSPYKLVILLVQSLAVRVAIVLGAT